MMRRLRNSRYLLSRNREGAVLCLLLFCCLPAAGVVIDRIAVIVNKHVVKATDIDRDVRVTEFLNRDSLNTSIDVRKKSAQRLIDQTVIREEMEKGSYTQASDTDVDGMIKRMIAGRFSGSQTRFQQELARYGLTEAQLRLELQWQADVLKFIDERFRPGVLITDDQARDYYNQHKAALARQFPQLKTYEALEPKIRASLEGDQINKNFEQWLAEARNRDRIVFREEALQ
jgi:peptidyl-prolyl cis-trans isomerase SurA